MLNDYILKKYHKNITECDKQEIYFGLLEFTKDKLSKKEINYKNGKRVYYISAEFLIGKLLSNNLINLKLFDQIEAELLEYGYKLSEIEELELEPSLGNGGLGRLAACFLDSAATLGLPVDGIGINYHLGLFKQVFKNYKQTEVADPWIQDISWLNKTDDRYKVKFKNFEINAIRYYMDISGYESNNNHLNLFDIEEVDESIVTNNLDYDLNDIKKNLTLFLYPNDSTKDGQLLRIYQQYFMVSCGAQYILNKCKNNGINLKELDKYICIQINDTHPSLVIPELIRLLQLEGMSIDEAYNIVKNTCAYTNHTILAEALEKWPLDYLYEVVPHLVDIIKYIDELIKNKYDNHKLYIIDNENLVHMAHLDIHTCFSVNGVAALHTDILKKSELKDFNEIYPNKINNKTNGIAFRRWLLSCNRELTQLLDDTIGVKYKHDESCINDFIKYQDDSEILNKLATIKRNNKINFNNYLKHTMNIEVKIDSIFDVQIKRLHEYKRQSMNMLSIIYKIQQIRNGIYPSTPITYIFGSKAATAYTIAKDTIHALLCLSKLVASEKLLSQYIQIVLLENYNVSWAEKIIPAANISEQISLASKEASGTSNMKFMLNGSITLGTMDGANVEIAQQVNEDNIFIFGKQSDEIIKIYEDKSYDSLAYYKDPFIQPIIDFINSEEMAKIGDIDSLNRLHHEIRTKDWFMTMIDLKDYIDTKELVFKEYENQSVWLKKSLINIAKSGFFSSDRTIEEYNSDIWGIK